MAIRVVELFAGVGGFRLGLERASPEFDVVWSNQFEPSSKIQHASRVYEARFPHANHCNQDISSVPTKEIPDHDLLVGGFPCQDYSVASTLKLSGGLIGKKGVLWWQIFRILKEKEKHAPKFLMLENVDRLLKSPVAQRGRDFAVMLSSLNQLGYAVEWRVINAADYGMPQRRRRIFLLGYKKGTAAFNQLSKLKNPESWILEQGLFADSFPVMADGKVTSDNLESDLVALSESFNKGKKLSPFFNSGFMINGKFYTMKTKANADEQEVQLKDIILPLDEVPEAFIIDESELEKWKYQKGAKSEQKFSKAGNYHYNYAEGAMVFPDPLDRPSRTIITGEGGNSASRFKHVIFQDGVYRRLTPVELERLNQFPDDHTKLKGTTDARRAFFMGNALVVGIVERLGKAIAKQNKA
ncbi:MAG: DNA (cytosine-5-)-methyltransferase [Flavobacteriales bacterium]|nr:DNA (cytosine-5-)-methyltransferase [Flavobacteriales bacterium]